jgi:hypothetical protein
MPIGFLRARQPADLASRPDTFVAFRQPIGAALALADAIVVFTARYPAAARFVGAIDVAGDERTVPNWLHAIAYQRIESMTTAETKLEFAAHVGEYFNHRLEGVRRVSELEMFGPRVRRAGHCLALSVDASAGDPAGATAAVVLEDLVWVVMALKEDPRVALGQLKGIDDVSTVIQDCTRVMLRLSRYVFGEHVAVSDLCEWYCDRFDLGQVSAIVPTLKADSREPGQSWPDGLDVAFARKPSNMRCALLFVTLLGTDVELDRNGQTLRLQFDDTVQCPVGLAEDARTQFMKVTPPLISAVTDRMIQSGTVVETCPSSNLALGRLQMEAHPIFAWHDAGVLCSVSTDDPAIFGSTLRDEFIHIAVAAADSRIQRDGLLDVLAETSRTIGAIQEPLSQSDKMVAASYDEVVAELAS